MANFSRQAPTVGKEGGDATDQTLCWSGSSKGKGVVQRVFDGLSVPGTGKGATPFSLYDVHNLPKVASLTFFLTVVYHVMILHAFLVLGPTNCRTKLFSDRAGTLHRPGENELPVAVPVSVRPSKVAVSYCLDCTSPVRLETRQWSQSTTKRPNW